MEGTLTILAAVDDDEVVTSRWDERAMSFPLESRLLDLALARWIAVTRALIAERQLSFGRTAASAVSSHSVMIARKTGTGSNAAFAAMGTKR